MLNRTIFAVAITGLVLTGCVTQSKYDTFQTMVEGSPKLRSDYIEDCTRRLNTNNTSLRRQVARLTNSSMAAAPRVLCRRTAEGVASGRLSYDDFISIGRSKPTPSAAKVLKGQP